MKSVIHDLQEPFAQDRCAMSFPTSPREALRPQLMKSVCGALAGLQNLQRAHTHTHTLRKTAAKQRLHLEGSGNRGCQPFCNAERAE